MKIIRMNKGSWGKVRAFFDVQTQEGFTMKGFKLVEGVNGLFVGFPSEKDKDGEYMDTVWADRDLKDIVTEYAHAAYSQESPGITEQDPVVAAESTKGYNDEDIPF